MILKRTKAPQILSGDIVAMTFIGKLVSVFVTIYTIFVVAIVTGVVVNYYGQIVEMQRRETAMMFLDKLERLPELSKEDLEDISKRVQKIPLSVHSTGIFAFHFFLIFMSSISRILLSLYLSPAELMKLPVSLFHDVSDIKFQLQKIQQLRQNSP